MKRLMVANRQFGSRSRYAHDNFELILTAQIHNMLDLGWDRKDIILLTNFKFKCMGVNATIIKLNDFCLSGSKMWATKWLFDNNQVKETILSSDLDCWQNCWFECPEFEGDVGASYYSNPKFNGGNIFWKPSSKDIVDEVIKQLTKNKANKEEPLLNVIFKSEKYSKRVSVLNSTYNVGCSGFIPRFNRSIKPIHICHFHPNNSIAWEIHGLNREGIGEIAVTVRLERILRKYYPDMATELKDKTIPLKKQAERRARMKKKE